MEGTIQKIRERKKRLHEEIDRHITDMLHELKLKFEEELSRIHYATDKLKSKRGGNSSQSRTSSFDRSPRYRSTPRSSNVDFSLNSSGNSHVTYVDIDEREQLEKKAFQFNEGEASKRSEVKLLQTIRVGDKSETVHAIAPVEEEQAWICCGWGSRTLALYDRHGQKRKTASLDIQKRKRASSDIQINDATTFYDGKEEAVLVSSHREKSIKRLNQESLRTSDFAYISLFPGGMSADSRSSLYVCFRDSYQRAAVFGSRRMVAKLSKHGEIVATIEKNEDQTNIFGYPFRVVVNINGDICVSDYGDGTRGVTILRKDGTVKCFYKGPPLQHGNDQPFLPHGITCDHEGHILVSDWNNDCVHVLDREGNFLMNIINQKDGIEGPNAVAIDKKGRLWVGDSHGVVRIFRYSLYDQ
ncbi:TRIM2-like protein [Mya arenaria]|uniref:TRIM2-like protein n=1 Tax=Mya arenaria TaxID=6604 RepID=A0ABY7F8H0_MYAAR|nr:TRIM2-like protein [Mya arenaria]